MEQTLTDVLPSTTYFMVIKYYVFGTPAQSFKSSPKFYADGVSPGSGTSTMTTSPSGTFATVTSSVFTSSIGTTHTFKWEMTGGLSDGTMAGFSIDQLNVFPEPSALCLVATAFVGTVLRRRHRRI